MARSLKSVATAAAGRNSSGLALAALMMLLAVVGCAPTDDATDAGSRAGTQVVSAEGEVLGTVSLSSSCTPEAQTELERGLALVHHMNYAKAEPAFRAALENAETVLFVGYSENRQGAAEVDLTQSDRTFFVKLGYAWVI